jgi:hypothetical protein
MSIKTETSEAMPEAVWSGGVLEAEGRDAGAFLQAQLMNDVSQLGVGDWQWNGWLSPKGRVIALTLLLRRGEQLYWLVLPDYPATRLADDLRRFQFRSKLSLRARDDLFLQTRRGSDGCGNRPRCACPDQARWAPVARTRYFRGSAGHGRSGQHRKLAPGGSGARASPPA